MKHTLVTMQVICNEEDQDLVIESLESWFFEHDIGMPWHSLHKAGLDTDNINYFYS